MAAPTKRTERFQSIRPLGNDLLCSIELATDTQTGQPVIIKRFHAAHFADAAAAQQFLQRAKTLAAQKRDGFQKILALGISQGEPWFACQGSQYATLAQLPPDTKLDAAGVGKLFASAAARLDQLHAEGRVHGDLRPETLVFDAEGGLLVGETAGMHALMGWTDGPVRLPQGAVGTVVAADRVAPEVARTGVIDPRGDQFALAKCLADCLRGRGPSAGAGPKGLDDVLRFALAPNPADRYRSCSEMVQAMQAVLGSSRAGLVKKAALALVPIAAVVLMYIAGGMAGAAAEKGRLEADLESQKKTIAEKYAVSLPKIEALPVVAELASVDPSATGLVDTLLNGERSKADAELDKQLTRLLAASRLKLVECEFASKPDFSAAKFDTTAPIAVIAGGETRPMFGAVSSPIQWQLLLQMPDVGEPVEDYRLLINVVDAQRNVVASAKEVPLDVSKADQTVRGVIDAPADGWKAGSSVSVQATILASNRREVWQNFGAAQVSHLEWKSVSIDLTPKMVKDTQPKYSVPAGIDLAPGDLVRFTTGGEISAATKEFYDIMEVPNKPNGPEGVQVVTRNMARYKPVDDTQKIWWAALMVGVTSSDPKEKWALPPQGFQMVDTRLSGPVALSINSVSHERAKSPPANVDIVEWLKRTPATPLKASDDRLWQDVGAYKVEILRGRLVSANEAADVGGNRGKVVKRIARSLGAEVEAASEATVDLDGAWEATDGTKIQISDTSGAIRIQQTAGRTYKRFDFNFERDESGFIDRGGQIQFDADPTGKVYDTDGRLFVQGNDLISIMTESMKFSGGQLEGRQKNGTTIAFSRVRKVSVGSSGAPKEVKKGLFAVNFSGQWRRRVAGCVLTIIDDGKSLKLSIFSPGDLYSLTGVAEKTETEIKVTQWDVQYVLDTIRPKRTFKLKCKLVMEDPNTIAESTDQIRWNGLLYGGVIHYGYTDKWDRVTPLSVPGNVVPGVQPGAVVPGVQPGAGAGIGGGGVGFGGGGGAAAGRGFGAEAGGSSKPNRGKTATTDD